MTIEKGLIIQDCRGHYFLAYSLLVLMSLSCTLREGKPGSTFPVFQIQCLTYEGMPLYTAKNNLVASLGYPDSISIKSTTQIKNPEKLKSVLEPNSNWAMIGEMIDYEQYHYRIEGGLLEFAICGDSAFIMNIGFSNSAINFFCDGIKLSRYTNYSEIASWPGKAESSLTTAGKKLKIITFPKLDTPANSRTVDIYDVPSLYFKDLKLQSLKNFPATLNESICAKNK